MTAQSHAASWPRIVLLLVVIAAGCSLEGRGVEAAMRDTTTSPRKPIARPTATLGLGQLYERTLYLERFRFRRDGDKLGGRGEISVDWDAVPPITSPTYGMTGSIGRYKLRHSRKPKKCDDDGCTNHGQDECRWLEVHDAMYDDWSIDDAFCNPIQLKLDFIEHDGKRFQSIGKYETNGSDVAHLTSPAPSPGGLVTECASGEVANTLSGKPARVAMQWNVQPKQFGALAGHVSCNDTSSCGEIDRYQFGQASGETFRSRMTLMTVDLQATLFAGTRRIYFAYDFDNNSLTGDPVPPFCGADYRVFLDFAYSGFAAPVVTPFIEVYNASAGAWQLSSGLPLDLKIQRKVVDLVVLRQDIGAPTVLVTSWSVFEQNNIISGLMPCLPCLERLPVPLTPDTDCPQVLSIEDAALLAGDLSASLGVRFTEPMGNISPGDISVSPALPLGTVLVTSMYDHSRGVLISALPSWSSGSYTVTLLSSIHDIAGNALRDTQAPGTCGVPIVIDLCVEDAHLVVADAAGLPLDEVPTDVAVYARGDRFPPSAPMTMYLVQLESLDLFGGALVDFSNNGPEILNSNSLGELPLTSLGIPVASDEYGVVVDVNNDNLLDAGDRLTSRCDVALVVGSPCQVGAATPFAVWSLDQKSGASAGERARGWHGIVEGGAVWSNGIVNGALTLNGTTNRVAVTNDPDLAFGDTDFSMTAWVNTNTPSGVLISHGSAGMSYTLELQGGRPKLTLEDGSIAAVYLASGALNCADGAWHMITVTAERGLSDGLRIYRDALQVFSGSLTLLTGAINPTTPLSIGSTAGGTGYLSGGIDEVMLFDEALTATDVLAAYQFGEFGVCNGPTVSVVPGPAPGTVTGLPRPHVYPNPTIHGAMVEFSVPGAGWVNIDVLDVGGRQVCRLPRFYSPAGIQKLKWELVDASGTRLAPGVYHIVVRWGGITSSREVVVVR